MPFPEPLAPAPALTPQARCKQLRFGNSSFPAKARARAAQAGKAVSGGLRSSLRREGRGSPQEGVQLLEGAAEQVREDIRTFKSEHGLNRAVMVNCASTEAYAQPQKAHFDVDEFEAALERSDPSISPAMVYAYAALQEGVPYANGAPSLAADIPALVDLADERGVPVAGKDFKTGQTLMKTIIDPGLKARMLGLEGWYSTNILGNRDGEVLDDEKSLMSKEVTKLSVPNTILQPEKYPDLYGDISHVVKINYYPPRGDAKEGWCNIDVFGWLGYPMQIKIKINFLARDSILAAPIVLDLAHRAEMGASKSGSLSTSRAR